MSRIGRAPIPVPDGVTVEIKGQHVTVKGPKGELSHTVVEPIRVTAADGVLRSSARPTVRRTVRCTACRAPLWPTWCQGVSDGFEKRLELVGVGYRAQLKGKDLEIAAGFSHPVIVVPPDGITFDCPQPTQIVVRASTSSLVGQVAADIRKVRPPEPYKGKGIKYDGEVVRRKVGKRA